MATVYECFNQVVCIGERNLYDQQSIVLITTPGYPTDTIYIKMIPDVYNIRYKLNPYCEFPCNKIPLVWWFQNRKLL